MLCVRDDGGKLDSRHDLPSIQSASPNTNTALTRYYGPKSYVGFAMAAQPSLSALALGRFEPNMTDSCIEAKVAPQFLPRLLSGRTKRPAILVNYLEEWDLERLMPQLADERISEIEAEITEGNTSQIRGYYRDTVAHHTNDRNELHRRRMVISRGSVETTDTFALFALLSVLLDDRKGWEIAYSQLGADFDPGFEFLAYLTRSEHFDGTKLGDWAFLLENAKNKGHVPATLVYWRRRLEKNIWSRTFLRVPVKLFVCLKAALIALKNPDDRRLTAYFRKN